MNSRVRQCFAISFLALSACSSLNDESGALSALSEFAAKQSVVEATIEFSGPAPQWVGPQTLTLEVNTRDTETPQIEITPDFHWKEKRSSEVIWLDHQRAPAGVLSLNALPKANLKLNYSSELAREQLNQLAQVMEKEDSKDAQFTQCLYPVRARLIRSDGGVVEKNGCRGMGKWEQNASDYASYLIGVLAAARSKAGAEPDSPQLKIQPEARTPASNHSH